MRSMKKLWAKRIIPIRERRGDVYAGAYEGESRACCGECHLEIRHDFESSPGRVIEAVVCHSCGGDFESQDVTLIYDEFDSDAALDRLIKAHKEKQS